MNPGVVMALKSFTLKRIVRKAVSKLLEMEPLEECFRNNIEFVNCDGEHAAYLDLAYSREDAYGPGISRIMFWSFED